MEEKELPFHFKASVGFHDPRRWLWAACWPNGSATNNAVLNFSPPRGKMSSCPASSLFMLLHLYLHQCLCLQLKCVKQKVTSAWGQSRLQFSSDGGGLNVQVTAVSTQSTYDMTALLVTASSSNPEWWFQSWSPITGVILRMDMERMDAARLTGGGKNGSTNAVFFFCQGWVMQQTSIKFPTCFSTKSQTQGRITGLVTDRQTWKTIWKAGQMGTSEGNGQQFGTT